MQPLKAFVIFCFSIPPLCQAAPCHRQEPAGDYYIGLLRSELRPGDQAGACSRPTFDVATDHMVDASQQRHDGMTTIRDATGAERGSVPERETDNQRERERKREQETEAGRAWDDRVVAVVQLDPPKLLSPTVWPTAAASCSGKIVRGRVFGDRRACVLVGRAAVGVGPGLTSRREQRLKEDDPALKPKLLLRMLSRPRDVV